MSVSSPSSPFQQLSQKGVRYEVRMGPEDGTFPDVGEVQPNLFPLTASRVAGGSRDDVVTIGVRIPSQIRDADLRRYLGRQVEVWAFDEDDEPSILVTWGFICRKPMQVDAQQETYSFEARVGDEHFGERLEKYPTADRGVVGDDPVQLDIMRPLYFNPEIDTIIEGNKSTFPNIDPHLEWSYIVDPESVRTANARNFGVRQSAVKWKLSEAVHAICWWLNPHQEFIDNPTLNDVKSAFKSRDELLKNVYIPIGSSLPHALDVLLTPLEYGWFLTHGAPNGVRESKITFYERGAGPQKLVYLQADGVKDIKQTNMLGLDALVSNADLANRVICYGEYKKREGTFRLGLGWDPQYDMTRSMDLKEGTAFNKLHPEVGRKFVLGEAGDYKTTRPFFTSVVDLEPLFNEKSLMIRRRFLRCLSQHPDADDDESNGYWVEWWNENLPGANSPVFLDDKGWVRVQWPFSVLEKECGIWFDGETPPVQLASKMYAGHAEDIFIRITATIAGDSRVRGNAVRRDSSPNKQELILALDLSDKFQDRRIQKSGGFQSKFASSPTDARNDTNAIQSYAEQIRNVEDALRLDMTIPLEGGLHPEYEIGDMIPRVGARNLSLKQSDTRMPQVVGIVHHFQEQQVELLVESFRKERPRIVHGQNAEMQARGALPQQPIPEPENQVIRRVELPGRRVRQ